MAVARRGAGVGAALEAFASQVHPVFMLPPLAVSAFGGVLAGRLEPVPALLHLTAIFAAVYTAHLRDGYVDFYRREEDSTTPLTPFGFRLGTAAAAAVFAVAIAGLWLTTSPIAVALTLPTWLIGYLHAPHLDTTALGASAGYPVGVALALLGGNVAQAGVLARAPIAYAVVLFVLLVGVKIVDDAADVSFDRSIGKRTLAALIGTNRARRAAFALMAAAMVLTTILVLQGLFPPSSLVGVAAFGLVAAIAAFARPARATMLLVRGAYLFLAALLGSAWYRPLA